MKEKEMSRPQGLRTWVEVDRQAIEKNYQTFRTLIGPKVKLMGVVKSNAYGHGLVSFSKELERLGVDALAVDSITEATKLREEGVRSSILVLGYTLPENLSVASKQDIAITLSSFDQLEALLQRGEKLPLSVHIKIDTGMHRQGFYVEDGERLTKKLKDAENVTVAGVYTHLANSKNPSFSKDSATQINQYLQAVNIFEEAGFTDFIKHASATSTTILHPEYHFDMVRIGIGLYGLWPSLETRRAYEHKMSLLPELSWKAVVSEVKWVKKGGRIGYDYTEAFEKDTKIAIIPTGYWHGYVRALSSIGHVLIAGKRARVLGRVSMDMIAVDVSPIEDVHTGSVVTLLGKGEDEEVTADELATCSNTTNYEVVTRINSRIRKIYF